MSAKQRWQRLRPAAGDLVLAIAIGAIVVAAASAWTITGNANRRVVAEQLASHAAEATGLLDRGSVGLTVPPISVAGLISTLGPDGVTRASFDAFSAPLLDNVLLVALEWAPMVPAAARSDFEARAQFAGSLDFAIVEAGPDGARVPASSRADFFPVLYAEPFADNRDVIGLDMGADPTRRLAIESARDTGRYVGTPPVNLAIGGRGVLLFVPVYAGGAVPPNTLERRAAFLGVAVAIYRPQELLDRATLGLSGEDISVYLFDLGALGTVGRADAALAAVRHSPQQPATATSDVTVADDPSAILEDVSFGDRRLLLALLPGPTYGAKVATNPLPIALTAAAAAAAVGLYAIQRRRFEGALGKAAARLRSVLAASTDAFIGLDEAGRIVDWSDQAERLFQLPRSQAIGRGVSTLLSVPRIGADIDRSAAGMERVLAGLPTQGESLTLELVGIRAGGSRLPVEITMAVSPTSARWSVACFVRDVTDRRNARDELLRARAREAIGDLTGRLAHDFNNLLGIIVGTLDLARDDLEDRPDVQTLLDMAINAGVRGTEITKALLAVARRQALAPADIDVNEALREVAPLLGQAAGNEITLVLDLAPERVLSHVDQGGLTNCVLNLVINSAHAMPYGGTIRVSSRTLDTGSSVSVTDDGIGMPPEVLARVFEPFFTTRAGGTGLGLAIVQGFAVQSGGGIGIESVVGAGTTVTMHLPPVRGEVPVAPAPVAPVSVTGTEHVVVVDDEAGLRDIASSWLRAAGYRVHTASSGPEGLEIIRAIRPRLLLTDVMMPGAYGGFELAKRARTELPDIRIVLASGYAGVDLDGVIESGLVLLEKPYRRRAVVEAVRTALDAPCAAGFPELRERVTPA